MTDLNKAFKELDKVAFDKLLGEEVEKMMVAKIISPKPEEPAKKSKASKKSK